MFLARVALCAATATVAAAASRYGDVFGPRGQAGDVVFVSGPNASNVSTPHMLFTFYTALDGPNEQCSLAQSGEGAYYAKLNETGCKCLPMPTPYGSGEFFSQDFPTSFDIVMNKTSPHILGNATYYQLTFAGSEVASFNAFCDSSCAQCAVMERANEECTGALCGCDATEALSKSQFGYNQCQDAAFDLNNSYFARRPPQHGSSRVCALTAEAASADDAAVTKVEYPYGFACDTKPHSGDAGAAISWTYLGDDECHKGREGYYRIQTSLNETTNAVSVEGYSCTTMAECNKYNVSTFVDDGRSPCMYITSSSTHGGAEQANTCVENNNNEESGSKFVVTNTIGAAVQTTKDKDSAIPLCFAAATTSIATTTKAGKSGGGGALVGAVIGSIVAVLVLGGLIVVYVRKRQSANYESLTGQAMYAGE